MMMNTKTKRSTHPVLETYKDKIWSKYFSPKQAEKEIVEKARKHFPSKTDNIEI